MDLLVPSSSPDGALARVLQKTIFIRMKGRIVQTGK
jgi:hypothetical protein